jgi:hypothetical protein
MGRYRVFEDRYFQAVYARTYNSLFGLLVTMWPVEIQDDTEWTVFQIPGGYGLTSSFALTPGPFSHHDELETWLNRHGLGLEPHKYYARGVAYFAEIEQGCFADAIARLTWLEHAIRELNADFDRTSVEFWRTLQNESDRVRDQIDPGYDPQEIIPLPATFTRVGWKRRAAIDERDDLSSGTATDV